MQNSNTTEIFWSENWHVLIQCHQLLEVLPCTKQSLIYNLNAIVRLSVCVAIVLRLVGLSLIVLALPLLAFGLTFVVYQYALYTRTQTESFSLYEDSVQHNKHPNAPDALQHEYPHSSFARYNTVGTPLHPETTHPRIHTKCKAPVRNNPFGNTLITEMQRPRQPPCQEKDNFQHKNQIEKKFASTKNASQNDVYNKHASQRQFFTMPWTTGAPDLDGDFGHWLYDSPPNTKEKELLFSPM